LKGLCYNTVMPIHILAPEVASQIAAGEVVERPASVVKELVENSLDAGARYLTIRVEGAGQRLVEVVDDGSGIPSQELSLAASRHATSKLDDATDLFRITTLGFRGEALASIGSVSRMTISSRTAEEAIGARLRVEAGEAVAVEMIGSPIGTLVRVEDLFYNVPARLKFLKTDTTERRQIDELVTRYALAYPHVRFHLHQEKQLTLQTSGNGDRREVLARLYGVDIARQMLEVLVEYDELVVSGFISPTSLTRSNRREITIYVNGRWIQDVALVSALVQAYHTMLMVGRYPLAAIFIELPAEQVDVNVHPAKAEVRFRDKDRVFSGVQRAVKRALLAYTPVSTLVVGPNWAAPLDNNSHQLDLMDQTRSSGISSGLPPHESRTALAAIEASSSDQASMGTGRVPLLRPVGQIASAYLVAEGPDGLYLIDQHAAHERVLFERYQAQKATGIPAQALLEPVTIELSPANARQLEDQLPLLARLGFQVEHFGAHNFLIRAIPVLLAGIDAGAALRVLVEDFEEDETPLKSELESRVIARVCKRAAVKAGQVLAPEEQRALLSSLEACQSPRTCPHGRPTMIHLSVDLLERQFGRRGAR
jgi:DNA mismatch repair protein MutL